MMVCSRGLPADIMVEYVGADPMEAIAWFTKWRLPAGGGGGGGVE
jgi:hypothetical protein